MIRNNLPGAVLDPAHPLSRGLVGWWLLNEKAGINVGDTSQNNNRGTVTNVVQSATSGWTGEQFGGGIRFDGSDDTVIVPHSSSLNFAANFTFSCWARLASTSGYYSAVAKGSVGANGYASPARIEYNTAASAWTWLTGNGTNHDILSGPAGSIGKLIHLVGTHQGGTAAGTTNYLYADTARYGPSTTTVPIANLGTALWLGSLYGYAPSGTNFFPGTISNVRVYNRALSYDEVRMLYTQPLAGLLTQPTRVARQFIFSAAAPAVPPHPITSDRLHNRGGNWGRIWRRGETT